MSEIPSRWYTRIDRVQSQLRCMSNSLFIPVSCNFNDAGSTATNWSRSIGSRSTAPDWAATAPTSSITHCRHHHQHHHHRIVVVDIRTGTCLTVKQCPRRARDAPATHGGHAQPQSQRNPWSAALACARTRTLPRRRACDLGARLDHRRSAVSTTGWTQCKCRLPTIRDATIY